MGVVSWNEINRYFIDTYCEAARAEVDMRLATNTLESLREAVFLIPAGASIFDVWATFDKHIGVADLEEPPLEGLHPELLDLIMRERPQRLLPRRGMSLRQLRAVVQMLEDLR